MSLNDRGKTMEKLETDAQLMRKLSVIGWKRLLHIHIITHTAKQSRVAIFEKRISREICCLIIFINYALTTSMRRIYALR